MVTPCLLECDELQDKILELETRLSEIEGKVSSGCGLLPRQPYVPLL